MPGHADCTDCPFADSPIACHALSLPGRPLCGPAYRHLIDQWSRDPASKPTYGPTSIDPNPSTFDPDIAVLVETCDFRRSACGCLSKPAQCLQGGYAATVFFDDCRACLARGPDV